jgi:hypothetical protein
LWSLTLAMSHRRSSSAAVCLAPTGASMFGVNSGGGGGGGVRLLQLPTGAPLSERSESCMRLTPVRLSRWWRMNVAGSSGMFNRHWLTRSSITSATSGRRRYAPRLRRSSVGGGLGGIGSCSGGPWSSISQSTMQQTTRYRRSKHEGFNKSLGGS